MADLKDPARLLHDLLQLLDFLDGDPDRLFAKNVLAGPQRGDGGRDMEGVRRGNDHGVQFRIGQHLVIIGNVFLGAWVAAMRSRRSSATSQIA